MKTIIMNQMSKEISKVVLFLTMLTVVFTFCIMWITPTYAMRFSGGSTTPGATDWKEGRDADGNLRTLYVDVDTSSSGFTKTPLYFTSLGGNSSHWYTVGANSIYSPTSTGFRVYIKYANGVVPTSEFANSQKWHIQWRGIIGFSDSGSTTPGATDWKAYRGADGKIVGIYVDVYTSDFRYSTPRYYTSLGGNGDHFNTVGTTSIYSPTPTGFRVYIKYVDGRVITPESANKWKWHIQWIGLLMGERHYTSGFSTTPGATDWKAYRGADGRSLGIYVDVDTSSLGLTKTPLYFTSLGGGWDFQVSNSSILRDEWDFQVSSPSIYNPTYYPTQPYSLNYEISPSYTLYPDLQIGANYSQYSLYHSHRSIVGATSIYSPTSTGFRVYIKYANGEAPTPEYANGKRWHVQWGFLPTTPPDPISLKIIGSTENSISMKVLGGSRWDGISLYRSREGGKFEPIIEFPAESAYWISLTWTDNNLSPNTQYCYSAQVFNNFGVTGSDIKCERTKQTNTEPLLPDLYTNGGLRSTPGQIYVNQEFSLYLDYKNRGETTAGPHNIVVYIDDIFYYKYDMPALQAGEERSLGNAVEIYFPAYFVDIGGWHEVEVYIDESQKVTESNEDNNKAKWRNYFEWGPY